MQRKCILGWKYNLLFREMIDFLGKSDDFVGKIDLKETQITKL